MIILKKKIKTILGLISMGAFFCAAILGILLRENSLKISQSQVKHQNYYSDNDKSKETKIVCSQFLEESLEKDGNDLVFEEYANVQAVDCLSVGCGMLF